MDKGLFVVQNSDARTNSDSDRFLPDLPLNMIDFDALKFFQTDIFVRDIFKCVTNFCV